MVLVLILSCEKETDFRFWLYTAEFGLLLVAYTLLFFMARHKQRQFLQCCTDENSKILLVIGKKALRKKADWSTEQWLCCSFDFSCADDAAEFLQNRRKGAAAERKHRFFFPFSAKDLHLLQSKTVIVQREFSEYFLPFSSDAAFTQKGNKLVFEGGE